MGATLGIWVESPSSEAHGAGGGGDSPRGKSPPGLAPRMVDGCRTVDTRNDTQAVFLVTQGLQHLPSPPAPMQAPHTVPGGPLADLAAREGLSLQVTRTQ